MNSSQDSRVRAEQLAALAGLRASFRPLQTSTEPAQPSNPAAQPTAAAVRVGGGYLLLRPAERRRPRVQQQPSARQHSSTQAGSGSSSLSTERALVGAAALPSATPPPLMTAAARGMQPQGGATAAPVGIVRTPFADAAALSWLPPAPGGSSNPAASTAAATPGVGWASNLSRAGSLLPTSPSLAAGPATSVAGGIAAAAPAVPAAPASGPAPTRSQPSADVLMAIDLLNQSLRTLDDTYSLINSILALEQASLRQGPGRLLAGQAGTAPAAANNRSLASGSSTSLAANAASSSSSSSSSHSSSSGGGGSSSSAAVPQQPLTACVVCMEAPRNVLLLPCKHLVLCRSCFGRMSADATAAAQASAAARRSLTDLVLGDGQTIEELLQRLLHEERGSTVSASAAPPSQAAAGSATAPQAAHREWLGPLPGTPWGALRAAVDQAVQRQQQQTGAGAVQDLTVQGQGLRLEPQAHPAGINLTLIAPAESHLRCPICRRRVEQSVSGVLIV